MQNIPTLDPVSEDAPLLLLLSVRQVEEMEAKAVAAERERCAKIAEDVQFIEGLDYATADHIAAAIRKGE